MTRKRSGFHLTSVPSRSHDPGPLLGMARGANMRGDLVSERSQKPCELLAVGVDRHLVQKDFHCPGAAPVWSGSCVDRSELNLPSNVLTTAGRDVGAKRHSTRFRRRRCGVNAHARAHASNIPLSRNRNCEDATVEYTSRHTRPNIVSAGNGCVVRSTR